MKYAQLRDKLPRPLYDNLKGWFKYQDAVLYPNHLMRKALVAIHKVLDKEIGTPCSIGVRREFGKSKITKGSPKESGMYWEHIIPVREIIAALKYLYCRGMRDIEDLYNFIIETYYAVYVLDKGKYPNQEELDEYKAEIYLSESDKKSEKIKYFYEKYPIKRQD